MGGGLDSGFWILTGMFCECQDESYVMMMMMLMLMLMMVRFEVSKFRCFEAYGVHVYCE